MAEVAGSVAIVEAANHAGMSFVDTAPDADSADAILDEVLTGVAPAGEAAPAAEGGEAEAKPEGEQAKAEPAKVETPPNDIEAAKLRKGFAKLADERQKLVELQNAARAEKAAAQTYAVKAQKHDELISAINSDPAAFLLAHGGEALVQKALQGFIDQEKSPAEREIAKLRAEQKADREAREAREQEQVATQWRNDTVGKIRGDERFDLVNTLGLHGDVIAVMTGYYDKHSERDEKGNVIAPAILPWDVAAQAVEDQRATMIENSKRYGKRTPAAAADTAKKDAPSAKPTPAPAKKATTSLSSVPVSESPASADELSLDPAEREAQILREMGVI